jgi:hypothetical protein
MVPRRTTHDAKILAGWRGGGGGRVWRGAGYCWLYVNISSMGSSNSSFTTKSYANAYLAFLVGIISRSVDSGFDALEFYTGGHQFDYEP